MLGIVALVACTTNLLDRTRKTAPRAQRASSVIVNNLMCVGGVVDVVTGSVAGSRCGDGFVMVVVVLHEC